MAFGKHRRPQAPLSMQHCVQSKSCVFVEKWVAELYPEERICLGKVLHTVHWKNKRWRILLLRLIYPMKEDHPQAFLTEAWSSPHRKKGFCLAPSEGRGKGFESMTKRNSPERKATCGCKVVVLSTGFTQASSRLSGIFGLGRTWDGAFCGFCSFRDIMLWEFICSDRI